MKRCPDMKEKVLQSKQIEGQVPCKNNQTDAGKKKEDQNARRSAEIEKLPY
jgi:hypothetical protein